MLGKYLFWKNKLAKIIGLCPETLLIEMIEHKKCPHCGGDLGKEQIHVAEDSSLFKENAKPIDTIK